MTTIAIIANGEFTPSQNLIEKIKEHDILIAVDGGLNHCHDSGLSPSVLIGDMDSASLNAIAAYPGIKTLTYPKDKEKTDLELAIEYALQENPSSITLFASLGNRIDHSLSNLILLSRFPGLLYLESEHERIFSLSSSKTDIYVKNHQTISLIPLNGPVQGITTQGLKWNLTNSTLDKSFLGISNQATHTSVQIEVNKGDLLCIINK